MRGFVGEISHAQRALAKRLRQRGWSLEENQIIAGGEADIFLVDVKIIVEVDGIFHLSKQNRQHDRTKEDKWQQEGYSVLRFTNEEVKYQMEKCLCTIETDARGRTKALRRRDDRPVLIEHKGLGKLRQDLLQMENSCLEQIPGESVERYFLRRSGELRNQ